MGQNRYRVGERVGAMYSGGCGTALDYSGVVVELAGERAVMARFSDGIVRRVSTHSDFSHSMEPAYRLAGELIASGTRGALGTLPADPDAWDVMAAAKAIGRPVDYFKAARTLWVLTHDLATAGAR